MFPWKSLSLVAVTFTVGCQTITGDRGTADQNAQEIPKFCSAAQGQDQSGNWVLGTWKNRYSGMSFRSDGDQVRWTVNRQRHSTKEWGTKAAMTASGKVKKLTPCAVVMVGKYDASESPYIVGKPVEYRMVLDERLILSGTFFGAQEVWVPMRYFRKQ